MAVKPVVDSIDDIDESLRSYYVQGDDGKYRLDGVEDVSGLKSALETLKADKKKLRESLERFKDLDPDEYTRLKQEREDREMQSATKKGEFEKLRTQMVEKHQTELGAKESRITNLLSTIQLLMVDEQATRAIAAQKGVPELLLPHVRSQVKVIEEDGRFTTVVVDKSGNPRIGDAGGQPMSIAQLVSEMRQSEIYGRAFEASGATGSGATSGRSSPNGQDLSKLPPVERMNAARAKQ